MKKLYLLAMTLILGVSAIAQQKIQFRSTDKVECVKSDSTIDVQNYKNEGGNFFWLT